MDFFQVDYFPSRYDRVQHAQKYPINSARVTGTRERVSFLFPWFLL